MPIKMLCVERGKGPPVEVSGGPVAVIGQWDGSTTGSQPPTRGTLLYLSVDDPSAGSTFHLVRMPCFPVSVDEVISQQVCSLD